MMTTRSTCESFIVCCQGGRGGVGVCDACRGSSRRCVGGSGAVRKGPGTPQGREQSSPRVTEGAGGCSKGPAPVPGP
jgi:hypothetical protein